MTSFPYWLWRREADLQLKRSRERRNVVTEAGAGLIDYLRIGLGVSVVVFHAFLGRYGRYVPGAVIGVGVVLALTRI